MTKMKSALKSQQKKPVKAVRGKTSSEFPSSFNAGLPVGIETHPAPKASIRLQAMADQLILQRYAPPGVLVNDRGDIFCISGRTGNYLEPAGAFRKARRQKECVTLHGLKVGTNGGKHGVDVTVQRLDAPGPLHGLVMIVFTDVPTDAKEADHPAKTPARSARLAELEQELLQVRAEARRIHEELQTSQEEFRSVNEERQSTNEELPTTSMNFPEPATT
jgi:two-component system CheB/CheR fusion protein